ncbi:hypothetical protein [Nitrospira sp. Nam80]
MMLVEDENLCATRAVIERQADQALELRFDYQRLRALPGVGPILALTIWPKPGIAPVSATDNSSSSVGPNFSTPQSGQCRGMSRLSKHGNARLFARAVESALTIMVLTYRSDPRRQIARLLDPAVITLHSRPRDSNSDNQTLRSDLVLVICISIIQVALAFWVTCVMMAMRER